MLGLESELAAATLLQVPDDEPLLPAQAGLKASVDGFQRRLIEQALQRHDGKWAQVARELDVDRANLSRLARRLGIR